MSHSYCYLAPEQTISHYLWGKNSDFYTDIIQLDKCWAFTYRQLYNLWKYLIIQMLWNCYINKYIQVSESPQKDVKKHVVCEVLLL